MVEGDTVRPNKSKGWTMRIPCAGTCNGKTKHEVLQSVDTAGSEHSIDWASHYQIVQCGGCEEISFVKQTYFSEDYNPWDGKIDLPKTLYPLRHGDSLPTPEREDIPIKLELIRTQTFFCYNANSGILCAVGLRALLEGICADKNIVDGQIKDADGNPILGKKSGNPIRSKGLDGKIWGLQEKDYLTSEQAKTLHNLRYLGNDAAHELEEPSVEELKMALQIIEHALAQIYELPTASKRLESARDKRKK